MRLRVVVWAGWMVCCVAGAGGWAQRPAGGGQQAGQQTGQQTAAKQKQPAKGASVAEDKAGERAFQQNCNRCHNAPEDLPPRVTGTILMHMRVRASLSAEDEQAIVRYMTQ